MQNVLTGGSHCHLNELDLHISKIVCLTLISLRQMQWSYIKELPEVRSEMYEGHWLYYV